MLFFALVTELTTSAQELAESTGVKVESPFKGGHCRLRAVRINRPGVTRHTVRLLTTLEDTRRIFTSAALAACSSPSATPTQFVMISNFQEDEATSHTCYLAISTNGMRCHRVALGQLLGIELHRFHGEHHHSAELIRGPRSAASFRRWGCDFDIFVSSTGNFNIGNSDHV